MAQAKKVFTMYGKYSNIVTYEYRGMKYDVEYAKDFSYCCTSPSIQHQNAQERIDRELDATKVKSKGKPFDFDEIWNMMGWD